MGVRVVSAHSSLELLPLLAARLTDPRDDPFTPDLVVAPGQGMIDWLQESLSPHFGPSGIIANVHFWHPNEFNVNATSYSVGLDDRWRVEQLQWTVLEVLWLAHRNGGELAPGFAAAQRKAAFALRVAELFDRYSVQRPEIIRAWARGEDTDGMRPLAPRHRWQPALWRAVHAAVGGTPRALAGKPGDQHPLVASARLTFFGLEAFSRAKVEVLRSLGRSRDVLVLHVSPAEGLIASFRSSDVALGTVRRESDVAARVRHPLLASWARPAVESAALLATVAADTSFVPRERGNSVLATLQSDIGGDRSTDAAHPAGSGDSDSVLMQSDGSIQVHMCHGATRQVEVLRDAVLHLLERDPTLTPRDVLVLCPDLERFAPVIEPVMAAKVGPGGTHLRVSIIDRSTASAPPVSTAIDAVLSLLESRCAALDVVEVLSLDPVRNRFSLDDAELARIVSWVSALNVQWGLNREHRQEWGYPANDESGTWEWAIDRLVAGVLLQSPEVFEDSPGLSAFDDISGGDIATVGKLNAFHQELVDLRKAARTPLSLGEWAALLGRAVENFILLGRDESDQLLDMRHVIEGMHRSALAAPTALVTLQEVRQHVERAMPSVRGPAAKWADVVRVGTLARFRGVPARVIALLGLDSDALKGAGGGGDDILVDDPWIGERDGRVDERLSLLTVLHAAGDHLIVTCDGHDVNDNSALPVPVPLEELKEAAASAIATVPEPRRSSFPLVINHSRQLADPVNVSLPTDDPKKNVGALVDGPWTFDGSAVRIVEMVSRLRGSGQVPPEGIGCPVLPPPGPSELRRELTVGDLVDAVRRPADVFLRDRLGVSLPSDDAPSDPEIPLWPDPLGFGSLGRELIDALVVGEDREKWEARRVLLGGLPLGEGLHDLWERLGADASGVIAKARDALAGAPSEVVVRVPLPDPEVGSLGGPTPVVTGKIRVRGTTVVSVNFSEWHRRMRLQPWVQLAVLTVHDPDTVWSAAVVGRAPKKKPKEGETPESATVERFVLLGETPSERLQSARSVLEFVCTMRARARRCPVPLFERTSWMLEAAKSALETQLGYDMDRPSHRMVHGDTSVADLRAQKPVPGIDDDIAGAPSRLDGYGALLVETWTRTVSVLEAAEKPKAASSKKARGSRTNVPDPEDDE